MQQEAELAAPADFAAEVWQADHPDELPSSARPGIVHIYCISMSMSISIELPSFAQPDIVHIYVIHATLC